MPSARCALFPLCAFLFLSAHAQSTWLGLDNSDWSQAANWDAPPDGGVLRFTGPGAFAPLNNDLSDLSVGGLLFVSPLAGPVTLGGQAIRLRGGITNQNSAAGAEVTIDLPLVIAEDQVWFTANDADAVTVISGDLSGAGAISFSGAFSSNGTNPPRFRLAGNNAGYTGVLHTPGADGFGVMLLSPQAQTSGWVNLNQGNRNLWLAANTATNAYTFWTGDAPPGPGEPMTVDFRNAGTSGLYLEGGDVHWNPTTDGDDYVWDAAHAGTHGEIRFNGSSDTASAPAIATPRLWHFGNAQGSLVLGGNRAFRNGGGGGQNGRVRLLSALSDDGVARTFTTGASLLELTRPAGGGPFTPSLAGNTAVATGATSVSDMNQLFDGWLQLNGGILILDGVAWSAFQADRSGGFRASGGVTNTWGITNGGSGFAARGQPLDIAIATDPASPYGTITAGAVFNRDFSLGSFARDADKSLYAGAPVRIHQDTVLTSARVIRVNGGNHERSTVWTLDSPVHEFAGALTGAFPLTFGGGGTQSGGTLRLSSTNNTFSALQLNPAGQPGGLVVLAPDDAVLGVGPVTIGSGTQGQAALLLFENATGTPKTFAREVTLALGTDASGGDSGLGSWSGEVRYAGTATITGTRTTLPVHVQAGTLAFTSGGGFRNDSTGGIFSFHKGGPGLLDLRELAHSGSKADWKWALFEGGLQSSSAAQLIGGAAVFRAADLLGFNSAYTGAPNFPRLWRVTGADHHFSNIDATGGWAPGLTLEVESGRTLSLDFGNQGYIPTEGFGQNTSTPAWKLVKTGAGTWVMSNSSLAVGFGPVNGAGFLEVAEGTLDLTGNYGRGSVRLLNGATLLSGTHSPFTYGTGAGFQIGVSQIGLLEIQGSGGRVGISPSASANVSRAAGIAWFQEPGARLTLAARGNLDLVFANANFPNVQEGAELRIERDGAGSGLVRLHDTAVTVAGTLSGTGTLLAGATGAGVVTVSGHLRPGAEGPGLLGVGHLALSAEAELHLDFQGLAPGSGHDRLEVAGSLTLASGARLSPVFSFTPVVGTTFTVVQVSGTDPVSGLFSSASAELSEGDSLTANGVTCALSYQGGDGNDITLTVTSPSASGFAVWIDGFGLDPADQDETDDPDGDGLVNLLEYFAGLHPDQPNPPMLTAFDGGPGFLRFTFRRGTDIPDLTYAYEWSPDLSQWHPPDTDHVFSEALVGGGSHQLVRATLTHSVGEPRLYVRLRILRLP
jgi:hypothetical protein